MSLSVETTNPTRPSPGRQTWKQGSAVRGIACLMYSHGLRMVTTHPDSEYCQRPVWVAIPLGQQWQSRRIPQICRPALARAGMWHGLLSVRVRDGLPECNVTKKVANRGHSVTDESELRQCLRRTADCPIPLSLTHYTHHSNHHSTHHPTHQPHSCGVRTEMCLNQWVRSPLNSAITHHIEKTEQVQRTEGCCVCGGDFFFQTHSPPTMGCIHSSHRGAELG